MADVGPSQAINLRGISGLPSQLQDLKTCFVVTMRMPESNAWAAQSAANLSEFEAFDASQDRNLRAIFGPFSSRSSKIVLPVKGFEEIFFRHRRIAVSLGNVCLGRLAENPSPPT